MTAQTRVASPGFIIVTALLLAATFVILIFMPRMYESSASILVEPRSNVYIRAANEQAFAPVIRASGAQVE